TAQTSEQILAVLLQYPAGTRYLVLAPLVQRQKGEYRDLFVDLLKQGYLRARVDGRVVSLNENLQLDRNMRHTIEVVIDRLVAGNVGRTRLAEAVTAALKLGQGNLVIAVEEERAVAASEEGDVGEAGAADDAPLPAAGPDADPGDRETGTPGTPAGPARRAGARRGRATPPSAGGGGVRTGDLTMRRVLVDRLFSARYACTECGVSYEPPSPQLFSCNSPQGMCQECTGLGVRYDFDLQKLIPNPELSLAKGAVALLGPFRELGRWRRHLFEGVGRALELEHGLAAGTVLTKPWQQLPPAVQRQLLWGTGERNITYTWRHRGGVWKHGGKFTGILAELLEAYRKAKNSMRRRQIEKFLVMAECDTCGGARLNRQACHVRLTSTSFRPDEAATPVEPTTRRGTPKGGRRGRGGQGKAARPTPVAAARVLGEAGVNAGQPATASLSLPGVCGLTIAEAGRFFEQLELDPTAQQIAQEALKEIRGRLGFLLRCGLDYLTLDRTAPTLSGGESQRIRLAGQIGCGLVGVLYILDEPSIGLHPRDNDKLLDSLLDLRDQGNTVIVVEHDEDTMRAADHVVDFGPGPGVRGGEVVAQGDLASVCAEPRSLTGAFLSGRERIEIRPRRALDSQRCLEIRGAAHNNLKGVNVGIPLGAFVCVTGVSGSGKSSLVNDILFEALNRDLNGGVGNPGRHERLTGLELLDKAIDIDQSPIGRTPRSNPATYVKLFDLIRDLYAQLPEAKIRGWTPGRFSFNVPL
ncbi:MAG: excinuclease ABC subunit A, partial [Planctomycetaceae bacterium]